MTTTNRKPTDPRTKPRTHRLGDGWHHLPAHTIEPTGLHPLTSEGSVLLLFALWAQAKGFDPADIHTSAYPDEAMLRTHELEIYRAWTEIPETIVTDPLCKDLEDINHHRLVQAIRDVEAGRFIPGKAYTHWVVADSGGVAGEARELDPPDRPDDQGQHFCFVRLFAMPDCAEYGYTNAANLKPKRA